MSKYISVMSLIKVQPFVEIVLLEINDINIFTRLDICSYRKFISILLLLIILLII